MSHIVAADDDPAIRGIVERVLTRDGHTVELCSNGRELVAEVQSSHPDAVVTDNEMPILTGLEARAELRASPATADIPVVMATGSVTAEQAAQVLSQGDRLVRKPFKPSQLRDAVRDALTHRQPGLSQP
jgi:CheY-like chemotaxis protein